MAMGTDEESKHQLYHLSHGRETEAQRSWEAMLNNLCVCDKSQDTGQWGKERL